MIQRIKNKVAVLRADPHMREVARGTVLALFLKVIGAGLAFGFNVAVARLLGAEGTGLYFLALSVAVIGSVIGRVGLDNALLRFIAIHATHEEWGKVKGVYALGMRMAITASGAVTLIVFLIAPWMATELFNKPELVEPLRWMSLSILPFALLNLQAESLKGLKCIRDAMLVQGIGLPLVSLLLIYPLVQLASIAGVVWAYVVGSTMIAGLGVCAWRSSVAKHEASVVTFPFNELWDSCKPLFITSVVNRALLPWTPIILLGIWASSDEVGVFSAASRVAMLMSFLLVVINNVVASKFAELYSKRDIKNLGAIARGSTLMVFVLISPIFLILIFQGHWVMGIYGKGFEEGVLVLSILAIGQLVNVVTGPVGLLLIMSGNEKTFNNVNIIMFVLQMLLLWLLIPYYGAKGAAIASALSVVMVNVTSAYLVYKIIGIMPVPLLARGRNEI